MSNYSRYAVYYLPEPGALADFGARWLGWDAQRGCTVALAQEWETATATPRKYGFHATLKPPFRLAQGMTEAGLRDALAELAARTAPARAEGITLTRLGRFLALTLLGDASDIGRVAGACVADLDRFRAPPTAAELARRAPDRLSPDQRTMLERWGYPYVFDTFRFHMTLTGKLAPERLAQVTTHLERLLPPLPRPFAMPSICLLGERPDLRFELLHRYTLSG